jgi:hypothetical protein
VNIPGVSVLEIKAHTLAVLRRNGIYTIADLEKTLPKLHLLTKVGPVVSQEILTAYQKWKEDAK